MVVVGGSCVTGRWWALFLPLQRYFARLGWPPIQRSEAFDRGSGGEEAPQSALGRAPVSEVPVDEDGGREDGPVV